MLRKLETLKDKIIQDITTENDIDIINEAAEYIEQLEDQAANIPEPAFLESKDEMFPANIIIENATIYIGEK